MVAFVFIAASAAVAADVATLKAQVAELQRQVKQLSALLLLRE